MFFNEALLPTFWTSADADPVLLLLEMVPFEYAIFKVLDNENGSLDVLKTLTIKGGVLVRFLS